MRELIFHLRHQDGHVVTVKSAAGAVYADSQSTGRYTPLITVSQLVGIEAVDDDGRRWRLVLDDERPDDAA